MEKYPKYKDSGVKWIGEIPEHWEVKRFTHFFTFSRGLSITKANLKPNGIPVISYGQIHSKLNTGISILPEMIRFVDKKYLETDKGCLLNKNDFVFADTSEDIIGSGNFAFNNLDTPIFAGYHTLIARSKDVEYPKFLAFFMSSVNYRRQIQTLVNGVKVFTISRSIIKKSEILLPPLSEQHAIVSFLEKETSQIDSYIKLKELEVERLNELKQAKIAHVVTKGLNPDIKMKDSGIAWIGDVPEHWEILRAKNMFFKNKRKVRDYDEVITCFRDGQVTLRNNRRTTGFTESINETGYQGIRKGDLVIHQMDAFAGAIGVSDSDGKGTSVYHCCTSKDNYDTHFYAYLIRIMAHSGYIQSLYRGIRERSSDFNFTVFGNQYLVIPPLSEQQQIATYIETKVNQIDTYISITKREIEQMQEYKQRLISDAVTGKIKVYQKNKQLCPQKQPNKYLKY